MTDANREDRILELRRLVQEGEYQIDPPKVAAAIVRDSEKSEAPEVSASKAAGSAK
jgi:anti-sigma28 factor (negative regulator of flagellin synthesis)